MIEELSFSNFEFGSIWAFTLLPLPILIYLFVPALKKRRSALVASFFYRSAVIAGETPRANAWVSRRNAWQVFLNILVWVLLVTAFASPQLVGEPDQKVKTARSFLVASDISFSMATKDWVVDGERLSRWEAIKQVMGGFLQRRKSDQIGLIFFGTNAYLQAPLTTDLEVIQWMLGETEVGMAGQMTGIGNAIGMGIKVLKEDSLAQRVMLLLTDGVDGGSDISPLDAANMAKKDSITIYTLGIGDATAKGSDLDEETLKDIASATGGRYFRAIDKNELEEVYAVLDQLEPVEYEEESYKPVTLLYVYPLVLALALIMLNQLMIGFFNLAKSTPAT